MYLFTMSVCFIVTCLHHACLLTIWNSHLLNCGQIIELVLFKTDILNFWESPTKIILSIAFSCVCNIEEQ